MKNLLKGLTRILPAYGVFPVIFSFVFNCLVYSGSRMIAGGWYHHNIETGVDRSIPFVPEFLVIYFGCYVFWAVNYILIARQDRRSVYQFFTGDFISRCVCLVFFLAFPTTNTRPLITGSGPQYRDRCGQKYPFCPGVSGDLFWMLCILGRQLHSYCKAGSAQRLSVFYRRFYIKMCLPCVFSCISNDKYKTVDHRERFVESGSSVAVFD